MLLPSYNHKKQSRASFFIGLIFLIATGTASSDSSIPGMDFAQTSPADVTGSVAARPVLPYRTIKQQLAFKHTVVEIIDWHCQHCRETNDGALEWGHTLPPGWVFVQVPIIINRNDLRASGLYAAIEQIAGKNLARFDTAMFSAAQDHNQDTDTPAVMMGAAKESGLDFNDFVIASAPRALALTVAERLALLQAVRPTLTPMFVVDGYLVTDSSMTADRNDLLFNLLNGLVSQQIEGVYHNGK